MVLYALRKALSHMSLNTNRTTCLHTATLPLKPFSSTAPQPFEKFDNRLKDFVTTRNRFTLISTQIEDTRRTLYSNLMSDHQFGPIPEVLEEAKTSIYSLKQLFRHLTEIVPECPRQHDRYQQELQHVVFLLAFMRWLETGSVLKHKEAEETLELNTLKFGLGMEDYLIGLVFLSNELPRYAINRANAKDYDCVEKGYTFVKDLERAFASFDFRNGPLRRKFDGMKHDVKSARHVYEEVLWHQRKGK